MMNTKELKKYIYENDKIIDILEHIGCHDIRRVNEKYVQCGLADGDNPSSTTIFFDEYIGVNAYTRNIKSEGQTSQADIINLVAYTLKLEYISAKNYLLSFLQLDNNNNNKIQSTDAISFFRKAIKKKEVN